MKRFQIIMLFLSLMCILSCTDKSDIYKNRHPRHSSILSQGQNTQIVKQTHSTSKEMRKITAEELCDPNNDTLCIWENGGFLDNRTNSRNYKKILTHYLQQGTFSARDIEKLYPTSVDEMNWFYSQLTNKDKFIGIKMGLIDSLMTLYADLDTLSCLPRFLNMYLLMDPRVIDREWMGDWNLNRAMYWIIPDNKQSFKSYYDTLDAKYEWVIREWCYAYQNF